MDDKLIVSKKKYNGLNEVVALRLPNELVSALDDVAKQIGISRNELIIKCLDFGIDNLNND